MHRIEILGGLLIAGYSLDDDDNDDDSYFRPAG
jgi:hypothetical protein